MLQFLMLHYLLLHYLMLNYVNISLFAVALQNELIFYIVSKTEPLRCMVNFI